MKSNGLITKNWQGGDKLLPPPKGYIYCGFAGEIPEIFKPFRGLVFHDAKYISNSHLTASKWSLDKELAADAYSSESRYAARINTPLGWWAAVNGDGNAKDQVEAARNLTKFLLGEKSEVIAMELDETSKALEKASRSLLKRAHAMSKRSKRALFLPQEGREAEAARAEESKET